MGLFTNNWIHIDECRQHAPWRDDYQVEQDLFSSIALSAIF